MLALFILRLSVKNEFDANVEEGCESWRCERAAARVQISF